MNEQFSLDPRQVHIWIFELSAPPDAIDYFRNQLSLDEVDRSERFHFPHLRVSYVIAHGVLRCLLAHYLNSMPPRLEFCYNAQGKPRLADPDCRLQFNLSHSGALAACAFGLDCEIGVDLEQIRPMPDISNIAQRFFSRDECADLDVAPAGQREACFFNCWTRKEAYIKAVGGGLSIPLDSFRVSLLPEEPARLIQARPEDGGPWNVEALDPPPGYRGAVAYNGVPRHLTVRRTSPESVLRLYHV
jgi:4'-phosphopantetheinyl transferase